MQIQNYSKSSVAILLFLGVVSATQQMTFFGEQALVQDALPTYTNSTGIPFSEDLSCESCVRGGYEYCTWRTFPS